MLINRGLSYYFFLFSTLVLGLIITFPVIQALPFYNILWASIVPIWFISALLYDPSFLNKNLFSYISVFMFISILVSICIATNYIFLANRYIEYSLLFIFLISAQIILGTQDREHRKNIFFFFLFFFLITSLISFPAYLAGGSYIARTAELGTTEGRALLAMGIGGYNFIYSLIFLFVPLILILREKIGLFFKILSMFSIAIFLLCIIFSGFFTAAFLLTFAVTLFLIIGSLKKDFLTLGLLILILIAPVIVIGMYFFIQLFNEGSSTNLLIARLNEFYILLNTGDVELSIGSRLERLGITLEIIESFPLTGFIFSGKVALAGEHSFILDSFAYFGIFGGLLNLFFFIILPLYVLNQYTPLRFSAQHSITFILFIVFLMLNNMTSSVCFVIFFLIMMFDFYENEKASKKYS